MKYIKLLKFSLLLLLAFTFTGCFEDRDDNAITASIINDFVWKGMNAVYLYKDEIPDLANDRFATNGEYADYLNSFAQPEDLFENLIYERATVDRFSAIIPNYIEFEQLLSGTSKSNGLEFNLYFKPGSSTEVFGIIRLVLNNSVADNLGLQRGQIFDAVNGTPLTESNVSSLLNQDTYTLNFATYDDNGTETLDDDSIISTTNSQELTKQVYTENPVHQTSIIDVDGENVGYLVYNGFNRNFNNELNAAFAEFQANNVQHLVLDLRYNPGGSVLTASYLGSMVTGQFTGEVYSKLIYNNDLQQLNDNYEFVNGFDGNSINSLNLNKVYVLTTSRSASASELVINSLSAYIDVVQIGDATTGKTQASITIYDSPNLTAENINPNHTYAMQPLIANSINVNDVEVPSSGLIPDISLIESPRNFGILGDINEPLLAVALADIEGIGRINPNTPREFTPIHTNISIKPFEETMYIDNNQMLNRLELK
ncbi:S41 family peptidase [Psychroserpens algicola]|uniref:S41 family peptidase n=1 Tax=Psychroserpens algicola TaxID=1719034 RepID=A0ABT0H4X5_9FLAO|nr:S41 family peptidase [Psychroserpens algicola]MCK8479431.1 S41 family peptidase [Psychroserpens algicola]